MVDLNGWGINDVEGVYVVAEHQYGRLADVTPELIGIGRDLADEMKEPLTVLLLGHEVRHHAQLLIEHGADRVVVCDDPRLKHWVIEPYGRTIGAFCRREPPRSFLLGATTASNPLASWVAADLVTGLASVCTDLRISDVEYRRVMLSKQLLQKRPDFNAIYFSTIITPDFYPQMATARTGAFQAKPHEPGRKGEVVEIPAVFGPHDFDVEVVGIEVKPKHVDLKEAKAIVSFGMGIKNNPKPALRMVEELAAELEGGMVGATRAAVEHGYITHDHQVGLTGTVVRPAGYFAFGVKGAVQHIVGMMESKYVFAVNSDKGAPIVNYADDMLVGDLHEVLPELLEAVRAWKARHTGKAAAPAKAAPKAGAAAKG
ncbi:MAG TPA: electron transfer flavoprotein subunit alpha/FixB family protein [Candidatus Thermoplasmatota archaeon]